MIRVKHYSIRTEQAYDANQIMVRDGKGAKDRVTMLPQVIKPALQQHLARVKLLHEKDLAAGQGEVYLPGGLERKYPDANREWAWRERASPTGTAEREGCIQIATER